MQITRKFNKNGRQTDWTIDGKSTLFQSLQRVNHVLGRYDGLLADRNRLDVLCQNQAIHIATLNKVISDLKKT